MRKNLGSKTYLYPMPVLIIGTYNSDNSSNAMNAAWGGISDDNQISICLAKDHKTTANIIERKAFTVSVGTADYLEEEDYIGVVSGNDVKDKFVRAGFHAEKSSYVDAPIIKELPMTLECSLIKITEEGLVLGNIVNISVDEKILTNGKIDYKKLKPITYDPVNHTYVALGETIGTAFTHGKKF